MRIHLLLIPLLGFLLTGCPGSVNQTQKKIEENDLNLPNPTGKNGLGIRFELSELFETDYYSHFSLNSANSLTYSTPNTEILVSIERFTPASLSGIQFQNEQENQPDLEALRDYFVKKRKAASQNSIVSEPIELYSKTKKKGWMQSVEDTHNGNNYDLHYLIGTISFKGNFYVVQMVAGKDNMSYLLDDFLSLIKSIR